MQYTVQWTTVTQSSLYIYNNYDRERTNINLHVGLHRLCMYIVALLLPLTFNIDLHLIVVLTWLQSVHSFEDWPRSSVQLEKSQTGTRGPLLSWLSLLPLSIYHHHPRSIHHRIMSSRISEVEALIKSWDFSESLERVRLSQVEVWLACTIL